MLKCRVTFIFVASLPLLLALPRLHVVGLRQAETTKRPWNNCNKVLAGVYIKFETPTFCPPPFLIYIFPQMKFDLIRLKNVQAFFVLFCKVLVNWGKNMHTFYPLGKKYAFSTLFHSLSIIFFLQHVIWPYFCPPPRGGQTEKYTPLGFSDSTYAEGGK